MIPNAEINTLWRRELNGDFVYAKLCANPAGRI
jgi:hypothetical protein